MNPCNPTPAKLNPSGSPLPLPSARRFNPATSKPMKSITKGTGMRGQRRGTQGSGRPTSRSTGSSQQPVSCFVQPEPPTQYSISSENIPASFPALRFLSVSTEEKAMSIASLFTAGIAQEIQAKIATLSNSIAREYSRPVNGGVAYPTFFFPVLGFLLDQIHNFPFSLVIAPKVMPLAQEEETLLEATPDEFEYLQPTPIDIFWTFPFYMKRYFLTGFNTNLIEDDLLSINQLKLRHSMMKKFQERFNTEVGPKYGINLVIDPKLLWPSHKSARSENTQPQQ